MKNQNTKHFITRSIQDFNRQCEKQQFSRKTIQKKGIEKMIQNYCIDMSQCIGSGTFSKVYKARQIKKDLTVAVKIIQLNKIKQLGIQKIFWEELQIIKRLKHPNIIYCYEYFRTINNCYTIYEYCQEGDLSNLIKKGHFNDREDISKLNSIIKDVFQGLMYLSSNNIIHRDIKGANIFMSKGKAKIGDFGFATICQTQFKDISIGSPAYMAPQGLLQHIYGLKTDVWSFGVLVYEMIHGKTPFCDCQCQEQLRKKIKIPVNWDQLKGFLPSSLKRFILKCLKVDYEQRQSFKQLYRDEYINKLFHQSAKKQKDNSCNSNYTKKTSDSQKNIFLSPTKGKERESRLSGDQQSKLKNKTEQYTQFFTLKPDETQRPSPQQDQIKTSTNCYFPLVNAQKNPTQLKNDEILAIDIFRFLKQQKYEQKDFQNWTQIVNVFNRIIYMNMQMQNSQLGYELLYFVHIIVAQIYVKSNDLQQINSLMKKQMRKLVQQYNMDNSQINQYQNDLQSLSLLFFKEIKEAELKLDIQDIQNNRNKDKYISLTTYSNLLIIAYRIIIDLIKNKPQSTWLYIYKTCNLQTSEQFYIWLYELQLQKLDQQQTQ